MLDEALERFSAQEEPTQHCHTFSAWAGASDDFAVPLLVKRGY